MEKIPRYVQRISIFIVAIVPALAIVYFGLWLGWIREALPLPVYLQVTQILTLALAIGSLIFLAALFVPGASALQQKSKKFRVILLILETLTGVVMCFLFGSAALSPEKLSSSAQLGDNHYYATVQTELGGMNGRHCLYKCNEKGSGCEMIYDEVVEGLMKYPTQLIVDQRAQEIHFLMGRQLQYTDGPYPHTYEFVDIAAPDTARFYLYTYERDSNREFVITRCDGEHADDGACALLPFRYSTGSFNTALIAKSENGKSIGLLVDDVLIFTYDTAPRCQVEGCVILDR